MMKSKIENRKSKICFWVLLLIFVSCPEIVTGDESLGVYGLKGYTYTYSPLPVDGFHIQTGAMYSLFHKGNMFHDDNLNCRDGYIWVTPLSLTYGDGKWWEAAVTTHWEQWKNTDFDMEESGIGDVFIGAKAHLLSQERGMPFDLSLMPYILLPTGDREKAIGDLYLYNPTNDDDTSYGLNLLLGYRWRYFYLAANLGINYVDTDVEYIEEDTFFAGLTLEYQLSESLNIYIEWINNENKNKENYPSTHRCYDEDTDDDIRELGIGFTWVKGEWGFKLHTGAGMSSTSPDIRVMALFNRSFSF